MQESSVTLIGGRRFWPSALATTVPPTASADDLPGFLHGWELLLFFILMFFVIPAAFIIIKRRYFPDRREGYEHV